MYTRLILVGSLLCSLGACADMERMAQEQAAQQRAADRDKCASYGYQPGSDAFADCMMTQDHRREAARADAARRDAEAKEREKDRQAAQRAADEQADRKRSDDAMRAMETGNLHPDITMPTGSDCTTTTQSTQNGNAGSMTSTTTCKH